MEKKNLSDLIEAIQILVPEARENTDLFVKAFFRTIVKGLEKDRYVKVKGLGTFKVISVSPRESVDVSSGERIEIGGHSKITFTPDAEVREAVNSPFAHLQTVVINEGTDISQMDITDNEKIDEIHRGIQKGENELPAKAEIQERQEDASGDARERQLDSDTVSGDNQEESNSDNTANAEEDSNMNDAEEDSVSEERGRGSKKFVVVVAMALTAILCFAAGFFVAEYVLDAHYRKGTPNPVAAPAPKTNVVKSKTPQHPTMKKDTVAKARQQETDKLPIMPVQKGDNYAIVGTKTVHELKAGENITHLAKQMYGSKDLVKYIIRFNGIENPDLIPIGAKLKIPELLPVSQIPGQ